MSLRFLLLLFLLIIMLGIGTWLFTHESASLWLEGVSETSGSAVVMMSVPYTGLQAGSGEYQYKPGREDKAAAVISVLEYWNPGVHSLDEVDRIYRTPGFLGIESIPNLFAVEYPNVYEVTDVRLESAEALVAALKNADFLPTPLITTVPMFDERTNQMFGAVAVVTGFDKDAGVVRLHDFWLGADRELAYETFAAEHDQLDPAYQHRFIAIEPRVWSAAQISDFSPNDLSIPAAHYYNPETARLFTEYAFARLDLNRERYVEAQVRLSDIVADPEFQIVFSPVFQVATLMRYAETLRRAGELTEARVVIERAVAENQRLSDNLTSPYHQAYRQLFLRNNPDQLGRFPEVHDEYARTLDALGETALAATQRDIAQSIR